MTRQSTTKSSFGLRSLRHPVRATALALAALAVTSGIATSVGIVTAMIGVVAGAVVGELLGRSRFRLAVIVSTHLGLWVLLWIIAWGSTHFGVLPAALGPGAALLLDVVIRYLGASFCLVSCLRAVAVRRPTAMALELLALAAAVSVMFAAHRDAVIERPLWLSDWAWRQGLDPTHVLLAIGGVAVVVLAGLLLAESRRRISLATVLVLPLLAILAASVLGISDLRRPETDSDLGLTESSEGDEPNPTPPGMAQGGQERRDGGGSRQNQGPDGGGGSRQNQGPDGGSSGGRDSGPDGGSSGGRDSGPDGGGSSGQRDGGQPSQQQGEEGQEGGQSSQEGDQQQPPRPSSEQLDRDDAGPSKSPAPMAVVLLEDDYSPESQAYYFRQDVWSEFNGTRLVTAKRPDADLDTMPSFPTLRTKVRQTPSEKGRTLIHARVALLADHNRPFALEAPTIFEPLRNPNPSRFKRAYRFESLALSMPYRQMPGRKLGNPAWSEELRNHYLQLPDDPRYAELANEIINRLPPGPRNDPFTKALSVKLHLDQNLIYSTAERHANQPDPAAHMLFGNRTGYCVHFAHAAVYLWRSLGIPSRVGTGYHVPEDNRRGSTILIRSSDGHAWPELYVDGPGWVIMDIAASKNLDPPAQPMDEDLQEMLGDMARENPPEPLEPEPQEPLFPHLWRDLAGMALALLVLALLALYVIKGWRRLMPYVVGPRKMPRLGFRYAVDLLTEAGLVREHGETREEFARRLQETVPALRQMTAWNVAARLDRPGRIEKRPEHKVDSWRLVLSAFRGQLKKAVSLRRRLLGLFNPISFFFSR